MTIADGFDGKDFKVSISTDGRTDRKAYVWTYIAGLPEKHQELLHIATLDELLDLRNEVNNAIQEIVT